MDEHIKSVMKRQKTAFLIDYSISAICGIGGIILIVTGKNVNMGVTGTLICSLMFIYGRKMQIIYQHNQKIMAKENGEEVDEKK